MVKYFCGTSDTSVTSDTSDKSDISDSSDTSNTANSSDASNTSASVTRLWCCFYFFINLISKDRGRKGENAKKIVQL